MATKTKVAKAPKSPAKVKKTNYNAFRAQLEKKGDKSKPVTITGRTGKEVQARKYSLTSDQIARIREQAKATGQKTPNPYGLRTGVYNAAVQSLINLGINQWHPFKEVRDTMKGLMRLEKTTEKRGSKEVETDAWEGFYNKPGRDGAANPLSGDAKIIQNFRVLQRVARNGDQHPYGQKLAQFCMSVDIEFRVLAEGQEPVPFFRLNTKWANEGDVAPLFVNPGVKRGRKPGTKTAKTPKATKAPKPKAAKVAKAPKAKVAKAAKPKTAKTAKPKAEAPVAEPPAQTPVEPVAAPVAETPAAPVADTPAPETKTETPETTAPAAPSAQSQEIQ